MSENGHFDEFDAGSEWLTPAEYWQPLADALGGFDLDAATQHEYRQIADHHYTPAEDGLEQPWFGDVWINPPYGRDENPEWAKKIAGEADRPAVDTITALVPVSPGTMWWHDHYRGADYYCLVGDDQESPRIEFDVPEIIEERDDLETDNNATFASMIVCYGEFPPAYGEALREIGFVLEPAFPFRGVDR